MPTAPLRPGVVTLHPQCEEVLRRIARWPVPDKMTVEYARAQDVRRSTELSGPRQGVFEARSLVIPGDGAALRAVLYRPTSLVAPGILVWLHGGGWVVGSTAASDDQLRALANASSCAVLSVDYRLAPEHRFPTPTGDALAAVRWAAANAPALGAERRVAVGGASAGGNLAAAVTLLARDLDGPAIDFQLLVYPVTCRDLEDAASRKRYADGYWLTASEMRWFWAQYLAGDDDAQSPYASPLLAESLADLPPAFILLAECDVLYDEGRRYAARLAEHGVTTELRVYDGMLHGFVACGGVVDAAWDALRDAGRAVREGLLL
jgi:acetyl esterase